MIRTQISFDKALYRRAQRYARRQRISLAELCRRGVREALSHEASISPWMRFAGAFASGDREASRSIDEVVYGRPEP